MYYLIVSIIASVSVSILLKLARQHKIPIDQSIAVNYLVAILLLVVFFQPKAFDFQTYRSQYWIFIPLGILLPSVFLIMGKAIETAGIVRADAAQRLSLLIAVAAAFTFLGDSATSQKLLGITIAFLALLCLLYKPLQKSQEKYSWIWLIGVWLGYGMIDILFKQMSKNGIATTNYLFVSFILAASVMFSWLLLRRAHFTSTSIITGIILGIINFTNIYTYIRAHQVIAYPALVFTSMNIGVITLATLLGTLILHEKINRINLLGIICAVISIFVIYYPIK